MSEQDSVDVTDNDSNNKLPCMKHQTYPVVVLYILEFI